MCFQLPKLTLAHLLAPHTFAQMFGIIVSGRPVCTESQIISPTQLAFTIPAVPIFRISLSFYFPARSCRLTREPPCISSFPPSTEFKLLGAIANDKPSAIFRVRGQTSSAQAASSGGLGVGDIEQDAMIDDNRGNWSRREHHHRDIS